MTLRTPPSAQGNHLGWEVVSEHRVVLPPGAMVRDPNEDVVCDPTTPCNEREVEVAGDGGMLGAIAKDKSGVATR